MNIKDLYILSYLGNKVSADNTYNGLAPGAGQAFPAAINSDLAKHVPPTRVRMPDGSYAVWTPDKNGLFGAMLEPASSNKIVNPIRGTMPSRNVRPIPTMLPTIYGGLKNLFKPKPKKQFDPGKWA